jgi:hypothetical protein
MFCLIFLLGHIVHVTELTARLCRSWFPMWSLKIFILKQNVSITIVIFHIISLYVFIFCEQCITEVL